MIALAALSIGLASYLMFPMPELATRKRNPKFEKSKTTNSLNAKVTNADVMVTLQFLRMCLGAGMTILDALTFISLKLPVAAQADIESVLVQFKLGKPLTLALDSLSSGSPRWLPLTDSLIASLITGSPIHDQLAELEQATQTSLDMAKLNRIKSVAVKSVLPLGLCFLPAFILLAVVPLVAGLITNFFSYPQ
jgi:type II secretory pathway component PulF